MDIPRITQATFSRMLENPGKHSLGGGLMLLVRAPGKASYSMRYQRAGARRELGLGPHPIITIAMARERVLTNQRLIADGKDPAEVRAEAIVAARPGTTFSEAVAAYLTDHAAALGPKAMTAWRGTLGTYAEPTLGTQSVREITTDDILAVLRPIWSSKTPTAMKLQRRLAKVMAFARARGWRDATENPARWQDHLSMALPKPAAIHRAKHQPSVPFEKLPAIMGRLTRDTGAAALAVRFIALTVCRATAGAHARWDEIDTKAGVWTIPRERMKDHPALRVPLSKQALAVLADAAKRRTSSGLVFDGQRSGRPLSLTALMKALRRAGGGDATTHGLRSSFKSWTVEWELSRELAEMSLGHLVGNDVERAYQRGDALAPRAALLEKWASYLVAVPKRRR